MRFPEWIVANGDTLQFGLFFVLLFLLATAERWFPRRKGSMDRKIRWPVNFFLTAVNVVAMGLLPVSFFGAAVWAQHRGWGLLNLTQLPTVVLVVSTLLVRSFISFFTHYLNHAVPLFWRVHRVHHLDTELDVSSTVRFHPLEFFIGLLPGLPIVVLFGLTPWVLVFYEVLDAAVVIWSHSNVRLPQSVDRVLRYAVVTPDLHRVHHSAWMPETDSNFGAVFPFWDLVFGTFRSTPRDGHEHMRLGLDEVRGRAAHRPLWLLTSILSSRLQDESVTQPHPQVSRRAERS